MSKPFRQASAMIASTERGEGAPTEIGGHCNRSSISASDTVCGAIATSHSNKARSASASAPAGASGWAGSTSGLPSAAARNSAVDAVICIDARRSGAS